jgi:hypothetical protein
MSGKDRTLTWHAQLLGRGPYFMPPGEYMARWDAADAPTDHELVTDHSRCQGFWPECKEAPHA